MSELVIWANSYCRSTLAFYLGLGEALGVSLKIVVLKPISPGRKKLGFSEAEFEDAVIHQYDGLADGISILQENKNAYHIFCAYQSTTSIKLIEKAIELGIRFGIGSEAPCNMYPYPKRFFKAAYLHLILPLKVRKIIDHADFILNYSGNECKPLESIGWPKYKIIACGYWSPAINGCRIIKRDRSSWEHFTILLSGIHQWHRSPMVLLKALHELDKRGVKYECNITQEGPLLNKMRNYVHAKNMKHVHFLGFLPLEELIHEYENCSIYVGAGNYEPWGMRLNDVLQCGSPLAINRGMGGCKLVDDYNCGFTFSRNNHIELANKLEYFIKDQKEYSSISEAAFSAAPQIAPNLKAKEIATILKQHNFID
ncbi:MAG: glycosyltransferase [Bacteroidales bacterium]|nr:glycosyltransferase [Candidatus Physcousia equi]